VARGGEFGYVVPVLHRPPGQLASACRREAALATDGHARDRLLKLAMEYEAQALAPGQFADALFREASVQTCRDGYVFRPGPSLKGGSPDRSDWGYWACNIADRDRLAWSDTVYELFGLPAGAEVDREWAVGRYLAHSQATLARVREFALRHACGFILDAEIAPEGGCARWIRVLAVPVFEDGRITRLHGLKRAL
jgi:PAS domain-containing protein